MQDNESGDNETGADSNETCVPHTQHLLDVSSLLYSSLAVVQVFDQALAGGGAKNINFQ